MRRLPSIAFIVGLALSCLALLTLHDALAPAFFADEVLRSSLAAALIGLLLVGVRARGAGAVLLGLGGLGTVAGAWLQPEPLVAAGFAVVAAAAWLLAQRQLRNRLRWTPVFGALIATGM